jgi:hypothetical protein
MWAKGTLVDGIRYPGDGPYLPMMGMAAELEVYMLTLSLIQMEGLMVEQNAIFTPVCLLHYHTQRVAMLIGSVIAPDDTQVAHHRSAILKQVDASVLIEALSARLSAIILVIAQTSIDRSSKSLKLLMHLFILQRAYAAIYDVACYQHQVRLLGIDHVYPTMKLVTTVMITQMQVAHHNQTDGFADLLRLEGQLLAILMLIVQIAIEKESEDEHSDAPGRPPVII